MTTLRRYTVPPNYWSDIKSQLRKVSDAVNGLMKGQSNNHYLVTLDRQGTTTELKSQIVGPQTAVFLGPRTPEAAAYTPWFSIEPGVVTFHHDLVDADRTYSVLLVG